MTEKSIKSDIVLRLSQGELKSAIYDDYKASANDEIIRNILASRPSYKQWKKFKKAHLLLSLIWGFYLLFELFGIFELMLRI